jgi:hypothetical protein
MNFIPPVRRCPHCQGDINDQLDESYEAGFDHAVRNSALHRLGTFVDTLTDMTAKLSESLEYMLVTERKKRDP